MAVLHIIIRLARPRRDRRKYVVATALSLAILCCAHVLMGIALYRASSSDAFLVPGGFQAREVVVDREPRLIVVDLDEPESWVPEADHGDLARILERGTLRVIVPALENDCLPRRGVPALEEVELAARLADELGVEVEHVLVRDHDELLPVLEKGYGDVVVAELTATDEHRDRVQFTHPTKIVDEWLVGRKGDPNLPEKVEALSGREVHVRRSSSYFQTLERLARDRDLGVGVIAVDESVDTETLVFEVGEGRRPLTVVDSSRLELIETYNSNVERLFPVFEGRELGWAVRKDNPDLLEVANRFIMSCFVTPHRDEPSTGDLDAIKERGSIRVLTLNNPVNYFLFRGEQMGFDYELARLAARQLGVRLEMVVPPSRDSLIPWLLEGKGDVIAAGLTVTAERQSVMAFSRPYLFVDEALVQNSRGEDKLESLEEALTHRDDVEAAFPLDAGDDRKAIAFALRLENVQLKEFLDRFVSDTYRGVEYNTARQKYFEKPRSICMEQLPDSTEEGHLSPYDALLKKYSRLYRMDWRLMAAQAYQESRFDPNVRSWAGAMGLFQIMPRTARELGLGDGQRSETGVQAGIKQMSRLLLRLESEIPLEHRLGFALAGYNAGWSHLRDARRLAAQNGWDADRWFGHTEKAMLLLEQPRYYRHAGSGYCRGSETVRYVSQILLRYDRYAEMVAQ